MSRAGCGVCPAGANAPGFHSLQSRPAPAKAASTVPGAGHSRACRGCGWSRFYSSAATGRRAPVPWKATRLSTLTMEKTFSRAHSPIRAIWIQLRRRRYSLL